MTKICILIVTLFVSFSAWSQGTVNFNNLVLSGISGPVDAPVYIGFTGGPIKAEGTAYLAELYGGPDGAFIGPALTPDGRRAPVSFLTGNLAGYFNVGTNNLRVIPGTTPGGAGVIQIRAWVASFGNRFEEAERNFGRGTGLSSINGVQRLGGPNPAGGPDLPPRDLVGLQSFAISIPEPRIVLFGLIAAGGAFVFRRRE